MIFVFSFCFFFPTRFYFSLLGRVMLDSSLGANMKERPFKFLNFMEISKSCKVHLSVETKGVGNFLLNLRKWLDRYL